MRQSIDNLLTGAGWLVQNKKTFNLAADRGVAVREFPMKCGHGEADYLLFLDGSPVGVVEARQEGTTLTRRPLPFLHQGGSGNALHESLEPDACNRNVFSFRLETLDGWLTQELQRPGSTLRAKLRNHPLLNTEGDKVSLDIFWLKDESL